MWRGREHQIFPEEDLCLDSLYTEIVILKQKQCLFRTTSLFPNCYPCWIYVLGVYLVLLCKESDFEIETEIISPCFQSVTIYSRTSVARTLMARLP